MNAIEIKGLRKVYPGFALEGLDLTLPSGCILGLIGENGAGKSTCIKLLLNMITRDGGTVTLLGRDNREDLRLTKEELGVVLDEVGLPYALNAVQIGKVMRRSYRNWDDAAYADYLARFALPLRKPFKSLSRGMKMKLGLAVALSHHPKLLLLDEATSGLDPVARDDLLDIFNEFTRDETHSILISSHIVSDLEKICDYVAFLHKGKLMLCEEKDALREEYAIVHCAPEALAALPPEAVRGKKENAYGAEALVQKSALPAGMTCAPVDIEQLFTFMVKEAEK